MKISHCLLAGALVALATFHSVAAQAIPLQVRPKVVQIQPRNQSDLSLLPAESLEKLKLNTEQSATYGKLNAEYKEKAKVALDKYQGDLKLLRDREQIKDARDKWNADTNKARDDGLAKLELVLRKEQKEVLTQVAAQQPKVRPLPGGGIRVQPIGGAGIGPVLPPAVQKRLQLTEAQQKQIADIQKEIEAKVMKVLTEEQRKQLEQIKKGPAVRPLPIQPNPRIQIQPAVPNIQPAPKVGRVN